MYVLLRRPDSLTLRVTSAIIAAKAEQRNAEEIVELIDNVDPSCLIRSNANSQRIRSWFNSGPKHMYYFVQDCYSSLGLSGAGMMREVTSSL